VRPRRLLEIQRERLLVTLTWFFHVLMGVSDLDEIGVDSTDVAILLMPLLLFGVLRSEPAMFRMLHVSHSMLRSFPFSAEK